jgi:hypothetical protein
MIHSFLMIGQSNMAGRGFIKDVAQIFDEHIKVLVNGRWQTMFEPISHDRPTSGISLAASFAAAWRLNNDHQEIGLIPCADGGTSLDDWAVGGALFNHAVCQAKLAQRLSHLEGILWHQGENDSFSGRSKDYHTKLNAIFEAFRTELDLPYAPIIMGGLGDFLSTGRYSKYFTEYKLVNQALEQLSSADRNYYFVTASGLTANPDGLHFDAHSQRIFGIRYYEAFHSQKNILEPLDDEKSILYSLVNKELSNTEKIALLEINFAGGKLSLEDYERQLSSIEK